MEGYVRSFYFLLCGDGFVFIDIGYCRRYVKMCRGGIIGYWYFKIKRFVRLFDGYFCYEFFLRVIVIMLGSGLSRGIG